jgi:hypothetical protein
LGHAREEEYGQQLVNSCCLSISHRAPAGGRLPDRQGRNDSCIPPAGTTPASQAPGSLTAPA